MTERERALYDSIVHGLRLQGWSRIDAEGEALGRIVKRRAPTASATLSRSKGGCEMSLESAMRSGIEAGLKKSAPRLVDTVFDALWNHPWYPFIAGAQCRLIEAGMKPKAAWELGRKVLIEYVRDEKVEFGDPRYDWGPQGGREVIQDCEIDHWDVPA